MSAYVWEPSDSDYFKIILKEKPPHTRFRLIGTRQHPVGDFDGELVSLPDEPVRVYRTRNGNRVFFTGRYGEPPGDFLQSLVAHGCDPLYANICRERGFYAMRVDPKEPPPGLGYAVTRFVGQWGGVLPAWEKLIAVHDSMTHAHDPNTVLV